MSEDPELESFLRQFRPRPPGPLVARPGRASPGGRSLLAAAAALVLAAGGAVVGRLTERRPPRGTDVARSATVGGLGAAVRAGTYESALDEMAERVLPDPARPGGALAVLADVGRDRR